MKKILLATFILAMACAGAYAQSAKEIKEFEKINKELLKQLKKTYGAKPIVEQTQGGDFYIVVKHRENKKAPERFMLLDEAGTPLYPDWLDKYQAFKSGKYFFVSLNTDGKSKTGIVSRQGRLVFPVRFDEITYCGALQAGEFKKSSHTYWHPASDEFWRTKEVTNGTVKNTFYSGDACTVTHEYEGELRCQMEYFWTIAPVGMGKTDNRKGLLTFDGKIIFPQEYNRFYIWPSGFAKCVKSDYDGLLMYGGKMLDGSSDIVVPAMFYGDLFYDSASHSIQCRMHRDDAFQVYDPDKEYDLGFRDQGERLYDMGQYQDVITYYEGEGYGAPWGNYYMVLAAKQIGDDEQTKMDKCVSTLKSETQYYLPIKQPDDYKFNAGKIATMYTSAITYMERYINTPDIADNDQTKVKARKLRGELVTAQQGITERIEEYGTALRVASEKNAQREAQIAAQQAQQQQAANALANGLTNLIFGAAKKK